MANIFKKNLAWGNAWGRMQKEQEQRNINRFESQNLDDLYNRLTDVNEKGLLQSDVQLYQNIREDKLDSLSKSGASSMGVMREARDINNKEKKNLLGANQRRAQAAKFGVDWSKLNYQQVAKKDMTKEENKRNAQTAAEYDKRRRTILSMGA